jgi:hypothetical protein
LLSQTLIVRSSTFYANFVKSPIEKPQHFYVLVSFEGKITDPLSPPSVWIIPAIELTTFIREYNTRTVISRAKVKADGQKFLHNWSLITG